METRPLLRYLRRRLFQIGLLSLSLLAYVWTGRIGKPTPDAYVAALYDATPTWTNDRSDCLVPELFDLRTWEESPMPEILRATLERTGWDFYEDTLRADSSVILWNLSQAKPAGLIYRFNPVRFEPFSAWAKRFLPGSYHLIGVERTQTLVGPGGVHFGSYLTWHVIRCWFGHCQSMGAAVRAHLDGWDDDVQAFETGKVGHCKGTAPTPPPRPDRWW